MKCVLFAQIDQVLSVKRFFKILENGKIILEILEKSVRRSGNHEVFRT